jgi:hypothetical protein
MHLSGPSAAQCARELHPGFKLALAIRGVVYGGNKTKISGATSSIRCQGMDPPKTSTPQGSTSARCAHNQHALSVQVYDYANWYNMLSASN